MECGRARDCFVCSGPRGEFKFECKLKRIQLGGGGAAPLGHVAPVRRRAASCPVSRAARRSPCPSPAAQHPTNSSPRCGFLIVLSWLGSLWQAAFFLFFLLLFFLGHRLPPSKLFLLPCLSGHFVALQLPGWGRHCTGPCIVRVAFHFCPVWLICCFFWWEVPDQRSLLWCKQPFTMETTADSTLLSQIQPTQLEPSG